MINQQWPAYSDADGNYVTALPISAIEQNTDGSAEASFDGGYQSQYLSAQFMTVFKPVVGGYLFRSQYGEILYMTKAEFEEKYTASSGGSVSWGDISGKPSTFPPAIGNTATTAAAGNHDHAVTADATSGLAAAATIQALAVALSTRIKALEDAGT